MKGPRRALTVALGRWHRRTVGELLLGSTAVGAGAAGATLLLAPAAMTTSPAMATLYLIAPRPTWGVLFLALAALAAFAAVRPTEQRFVVVMSVEVGAQAAWAVGLTAPSFEGPVSNLLAPIAWGQLVLVAVLILTAGTRPILPPRARRRRRRTDQVQ